MKVKINAHFAKILNSDKFFNDINMYHRKASATAVGDDIPVMVAECNRKDMKVVSFSKNVINTLKHLKAGKFSRKDLVLDSIPEALVIILNDKMFVIYQTLMESSVITSEELYYVYSISTNISEESMGAGLIGLNPIVNMKGSTISDEDYDLLTSALVYLFYGTITTKVCKPKIKYKINNYVSLVNPLKTDLHYVDTLWKQRINTEGFPVRGHFRLQPYKNNKRKLIWIEAYQKKGYTRKAGVELANI